MKNVKQIACASILAVAMLFTPGTVNAENTSEVINTEYEVFEEFACTMTVKGKTSSGDEFEISGSCKEVKRRYKQMKEL